MKRTYIKYLPLLIGILLGIVLYYTLHWWGFLVLFPWIGASIALGLHLMLSLPPEKKDLGRRISILLNAPVLLLFVPLVQNENLQLEGVALLVFAGYLSGGFIHYAVAKLFGPLVWGRGFCGWACWTAAVLDWLPIRGTGTVPAGLRNLRYAAFILSISIPAYVLFGRNYDVAGSFIGKAELSWMVGSNAVYYALAVPLAFLFRDRRAFCKTACPVSVVMQAPSRFALIRKKPSGRKCTGCSLCNRLCPMDIDVMLAISSNRSVPSPDCILCGTCKNNCPARAII